MYDKHNTILMKSTASFNPRNLSLFTDREYLTYAVISRNTVNLTVTNESGALINQKQVVPKLSKDLASPAAETGISPTLIQAKFVNVSQRVLLVICSNKGIFFYEEDGDNLVYFHSLKNLRPNQTEETLYSRGITSLKPNLIAIGTSSASILVFEIPPKGNSISLIETITDEKLNSGITDLISNEEFLIASDTNGNIFSWVFKATYRKKILIRGNSNSCTCLSKWKNYFIAAYGNGLISFFDLDSGKKFVDISAHAKWISGLDVCGDKLVSAGEDCFVRVWQLDDAGNRIKINISHSEKMLDSFITGVVFNKQNEDLCISAFDNNEILILSSQ